MSLSMQLSMRLAVLFLLACSVSAAVPDEEDIRLLEYVLDDIILSDAIVAYAGPATGTLLPLGASAQLIDVAITVNGRDGTAQGFVLNEKRAFHLDVGRGIVTVGGTPRRFDRELVRVYGDDIYVDSTLLGEWLPAAFDVELFALRVRIRAREPLPLQTRLDRERRIRHWRLRLAPGGEDYGRVTTSYRLFDAPSIDQTVRLALGAEQLHASYATYATGDFLYMESETYLAGNDADLLDDWRATLRRRDMSGTIGGPLRATEFAVGHVLHPASTLLSASTDAAPGILLTNNELYRTTEFDKHSLRGNLPPGWDVELYHNGTLIDYRQAGPDGLYVFDGVPMLFGMNFFRLIFYGPQGQRREEEHRFLLGDSLTKPGRLEYRLAATVASAAEHRGSLFFSYGITRHLTATAEVATLPTPAGSRRFMKAGARMFWSALFLYGDYALDGAGGSAYEAGLQTRVAGVNIIASRTGIRDGYVSEALHTSGDPVLTRNRIRVDTAIPASILPRLPLTAEIERQELPSGIVRTVIQGRVAASYKGLSISNRVLRTAMSGQVPQTEAGVQFSRQLRRIGVRGEVLYGLAPVRITSANVSIERSLGPGYRLYGSAARSFVDGRHIFSVGIDKSGGTFAAGMEARLTGSGDSVANINLSAGLGHDPHLGVWTATARTRAGFGAASVRVFLDRNRNDRFDGGDEPLQGVAFTVNGIERVERTAANGLAHVGDLSPHAPTKLDIAAWTLEDPQWVSALGGVSILPRPGKVVSIDIAVIATSEVEGSVTRVAVSGLAIAAPAVAIEVVNAAGTVTQKTTTSYDGYYVVSKVRPGQYTVRIAAVGEGTSRNIVVGPNDVTISGVDLRLAPQGGGRNRAMPATTGAAPAARAGHYVVQFGAFAIRANAEILGRRVKVHAAVSVDHRGPLYFVEAGPFASRTEADAVRLSLAGHGFAGIVRTAP